MNTKQLNRMFARAMYGMVIVVMVFSVSAVAFAAPESSKLQIGGPPALAWLQVNEDGFGDSQNQQIPSLVVFGGYLYAGVWHWDFDTDTPSAQIWRTPDGSRWELVNETDANGAAALAVFKGYIYSGSWDGKVWRSKDGVNWGFVTTDGFGGYNGENGIARFAVFKNALYASTWATGEIWRTTNGIQWEPFVEPAVGGPIASEVFDGYLYWGVGNWETGAKIWRTDGVTTEAVMTDGFGIPDNFAVSSLAKFGDYLYAGMWNPQGVQVWRSSSGSDWEQMHGIGNPAIGPTSALEVYKGQLYLVVENVSAGLEVWRTLNGIDWEQVGSAGFGDGNNQWSYWDNATTVFKGNLFIATNNFATGGEVWRFTP